MELLKNVFIRLVRGGFTDRVIIIDNVPQEMFYELQHPRVAVGKGQEQHWEADRTQTRVMTLYPELSFSQTGDGSIVFDLENEHSKNRYLALDRFVKSVFPNNRLPAEPVVYSTDPMDQSAPLWSCQRFRGSYCPLSLPPSRKRRLWVIRLLLWTLPRLRRPPLKNTKRRRKKSPKREWQKCASPVTSNNSFRRTEAGPPKHKPAQFQLFKQTGKT
jgi:hypothetical protein